MTYQNREVIQLHDVHNGGDGPEYWPPSYEFNQFAGCSRSDIKIDIPPELQQKTVSRNSDDDKTWSNLWKTSYLRHLTNMESFSLKSIFCIHFVLTVWAGLSMAYLPFSYQYMHLIILAFAAYAILYPDHSEAVQMTMVLMAGSILLDIIFIAVYQPISHDVVERLGVGAAVKNSYRFSLGMSIVNLLFKPFSVFMLYRIFQERGGTYGDLGIPGIPQFSGGPSGNYENIDQSSPSHIETAAPHSGMEKDFMNH